MIGKSLGHYEITDNLGEGGMGVVCRARDSKLGRNVAIEVLTAHTLPSLSFENASSGRRRRSPH